MTAGSYHDRVDDDEGRTVLLQFVGNDPNRFGYADHADFNGVDVDIFKDGIDLRCNQFRRDVHIPANALGILRHNGRNDIQAKQPWAQKVLQSAAAPAPPDGSVPAMDNTCFIIDKTSNHRYYLRDASQNFKLRMNVKEQRCRADSPAMDVKVQQGHAAGLKIDRRSRQA